MSFKLKAEAYAGLLQQYREVFRFSWNNRRKLSGDLFTASEAEFLPAALSLQERPVSPAARWTAKVLIALLAVLILWATFGKVNIVVNAAGKIIPSGHTKEVASVDVAKVVALHVRDGQQVRAGEPLVELDTGVVNAERAQATASVTAARLKVASAKALISALDGHAAPRLPVMRSIPQKKWRTAQAELSAHYQDFIAQLQRLNGDILDYREELPLAKERARDDAVLAQNHDISLHHWLSQEQAAIELSGKLADAEDERRILIRSTRRRAYQSWTSGANALADAKAEVAKATARSRLMTLTAPINGTVQQLRVHTVGGVVPAARPLMVIVPRRPHIEAEAHVADKDIGFVRVGQRAAVKIDAFNFTHYGTIAARVMWISKDAMQKRRGGLVYAVRLLFSKPTILVGGRNLPLSPGMAVQVGIKTGKRRVIRYFLSPLIRYQKDSLHER